MKEIQLANGKGVALVDDADYDMLMAYQKRWFNANGYAAGYKPGSSSKEKPKGSVISMHNVIMQPPEGFEVDHKNHNKLDNQRSNLRVVSHGVNQTNKKVLTKASSGYRGVYLARNKSGNFWKGEYRMRYLGTAPFTEEGALKLARLYDAAALADQGPSAQVNFPITQSRASDGGGLRQES